MTIEKIIKQNEHMESFKAGYTAALQWMVTELENEREADEAKKAKEAEHADAVSQA